MQLTTLINNKIFALWKKVGACFVVLLLACSLFALSGCSSSDSSSSDSSDSSSSSSSTVDYANMDFTYSDKDKDASYDASDATTIVLDGTNATISGDGAACDNGVVTISKKGTYILSGTFTGQIKVEASEDKKVQLVLNGVSITNESGPCIYVKETDKCFVTLAEGTSNTITDGSTYSATGDDDPDAAIYSEKDITFNGSGSLTVNANYKFGIYTKDDLTITGGTYVITSKDDAIRGKDSVKISDGTFTITAGETGIKSNKSTDPVKGFVCIDGGTFTITAGNDGIHAETALVINGGTIDVSNSVEGYEACQIYVNGGDSTVAASDDGLNASAVDTTDSSTSTSASASTSAPTVPSTNSTPQSTGQSVGNASQSATVPSVNSSSSAPQANAPSGNADNAGAKGSNGTMDNAMQGGEAQGDATQKDASLDPMSGTSEDCLIQINGGTLTVVAQGDGIDSNGSIEIKGGTVYVSGPTNGGNSAIDYQISATISGGTVIAAGSTGMAESFTGGSQPFALVNISGQANETITVSDSSGNTIMSYTPVSSYGCVFVSSSSFTEGSNYTITAGSSSTTFSASTSSSSAMMGVPSASQGSADNAQPGLQTPSGQAPDTSQLPSDSTQRGGTGAAGGMNGMSGNSQSARA